MKIRELQLHESILHIVYIYILVVFALSFFVVVVRLLQWVLMATDMSVYTLQLGLYKVE